MEACDSIAEKLKDLPAMPGVVIRLQSLTKRDDVGSHEVAQILEKDTAIVAKVLKLVNSPFYGISQRVSSIEEAVAILGFNALHQLALSTAVFHTLASDDSVLDVNDFWRHSFGVGTITKHLCRGQTKDTQNEAMMGGLLHDVGRLVFASADTQKFKAFYFERAAVTDIEDEAEFFGIDHQAVGAMLAQKWNFPESIKQMIGKHHCPDEAVQAHSLLVGAVSVADLLCHTMSVGFSASSYATDFSSAAWKQLNLEQKDLEVVLTKALAEIHEADSIFRNA